MPLGITTSTPQPFRYAEDHAGHDRDDRDARRTKSWKKSQRRAVGSRRRGS